MTSLLSHTHTHTHCPDMPGMSEQEIVFPEDTSYSSIGEHLGSRALSWLPTA